MILCFNLYVIQNIVGKKSLILTGSPAIAISVIFLHLNAQNLAVNIVYTVPRSIYGKTNSLLSFFINIW